jgi:formate-dependent nitrite reductase membrane component NrfD
MKPQAQKEWGTRVALDFFLGGAGAGLIGVYLLAALLAGNRALNFTMLIGGAVLVIAGALLLASELGRPVNARRSFLNAGTSWMARGAALNFVLVGLVVLLLIVERAGGGISTVLAVLAIVAAVLVAAYPGLVLYASRDIGLWRSPWLPLLFLVYSLLSGVSLLLLADAAASLSPGFSLAQLALALVVVAIVLFALYCSAVAQARAAGVRQGWRRLMRGDLRPAFVIGGIAAGLVLPLICFLSLIFLAGQQAALPATVGSLGVLAGAFLVRHCLLRAACHEPLGFLSKAS